MKELIEGAGKLGIKLNSRQVKQFELYYQELIEWNKKINLTAITDYSSVQVKHFLDSLTITLALSEEEVERARFQYCRHRHRRRLPRSAAQNSFPPAQAGAH